MINGIPYSFFRNCSGILLNYDGKTPFHLYLKKCFNAHKNWGSKDRKRYRDACYIYWRFALPRKNLDDSDIIQWLKNHYPIPQLQISNPYEPYETILSSEIDTAALQKWYTTEPNTWIRINNGHEKTVKGYLEATGIRTIESKKKSLALPSQSNLNELIENGSAYIQDISSQLAMNFDNTLLQDAFYKGAAVWDCCSGSGGKSITLALNNEGIDLICSDIRQSILDNLLTRFTLLKIKLPAMFCIDLSTRTEDFNSVDIAIADLPCSGSGTWRRNPENIHFFDPKQIVLFAKQQILIVQNILPNIKSGGYLVYLTCSLFKEENEMNVAQLIENFGLLFIDSCIVGGHSMGGDYLYRAILQKPLV